MCVGDDVFVGSGVGIAVSVGVGDDVFVGSGVGIAVSVGVGDDVFVGSGVGIAVSVGVGGDVSSPSVLPGVPVGGTAIVFGIAGLTTIDESNALLAAVAVALSEDLGEPNP